MKLPIFALALSMSLAPTVFASSMQQEQPVRESAAASAPAARHHPLFTVKYVLLREPPEVKDSPRIDLTDDRAAIHAVPPGGPWQSVLLGGGFGDPNAMVCSGWDCMDAH
ncbi:hypothetical protein [Rhodanobacter ginsengiterrae]|uniref:hypothetical protein n=1 Tax=Rhodanobacter ginsengiterrae TaxID=2008451 RepID=UPI003CEB03DC